MKRSKVIISLILIILLLSVVFCGLFACDFTSGNGGGNGGGTGGGDDDIPVDDTPIDFGDDDDDGGSGNNKPVKPPVKPPKKDPVNGGSEGGVQYISISPYALIGELMGGTQVKDADKKYRIVNLYIDAMSADRDTGIIKKKRFIFRTNIDQQGMANNFAVQLVDLSNLVEQPNTEDTNTIVSTDEGEVSVSVSAAKLADDLAYESQGKVDWGFYAIDNKMYMDVGQDKPLLYFEDFDMDYMKQILFAAKDLISDGNYDGSLQGPLFLMLNDLIKIMTVDGLLNMLGTFLFEGSVYTTTTDPDTGVITKDYSCTVTLNKFVENIGALVGLVSAVAGGALPFELNLEPLIGFLQEWLPQMQIKILGQTVDGVTKKFDLVATRTDITDSNDPLYKQQIFGAEIKTDRCYSDSPYDFGIPDRVKNNLDFEPFSLTNIALSLDIGLNSGGPVDLGSVINTFVNKELLPEGVLILDVATGLRLDLALDLDLNYGKETTINEQGKEVLIDRNLIMLELFLIDPITGNNVDDNPLLGVYYKDGAAYVNVSHLLKDYYAGNNIKINLDGVPDLIQYVVNLVTNALDGVFTNTLNIPNWVNWKDLRQSRLDEINKPQDNPVTEENTNLAGTINEENDDTKLEPINVSETCVALARNEYGEYQVSMNLVTFLKGVGSVVGFGDVFGTNKDKTAITITANQIFWDALNALAGIEGFSWPGGLNAEIALNFDEKPDSGKTTMTDISISAVVDSRTGFTDAQNNWYIGSKATYKKIAFVKDGVNYADIEATKTLDIPVTDSINNYALINIETIDSTTKYTLNGIEVMVIVDATTNEYVAYKDVVATNINSSEINVTSSKKTLKAFVYQDEWVIGYGHDKDSTYKSTGIAAQGLRVGLSLHDIMLCYGSHHLKRFDPDWGGKSYDGYFGAPNNLAGYILYKTHNEQIVEGLNSSSTGKYFVYNSITKEYTEVELGTGENQTPYDPNVTYYQIVEKGYVDSISKFLTSILGGTFLSLNLTVDFSKGAYNLAPLISLFGLDALKDKLLLWEFTGDFKLDVNLNIAIALDKNNPDNSKLVVEIKVADDQDIVIGEGENATVLFGKGQTILGLYGIGKKVYVEVSNLRLLNIKLPDLYLELDYTTLIYSLIGEKEILDLSFNLTELLGLSTEDPNSTEQVAATLAAAGEEGSSGTGSQSGVTDAASIYIDSNVVSVSITIAALQALLTAFGVDLGMNLTDAMRLAVDLVLNRTGGITIDINGALLPKYSKDRGNYFDEDLHIGLQMGTEKAPVQIGDTTELMKRFNKKFETLAASTSQFHENIIDALVKVIGDLKLELTIDAQTLESIWDINRIVDTIVADQGDKFALPLQVNFDDWKTQAKIVLQLYLDLNNFKNTQVLIELQFEGNVWIGLYIYRNSIVVDLNGLGLFDFEIANSTIVAKAGNVLSNLLGSLGDLSLTTLLNGLIDDLLNPAEQGDLAQTEGEVAQAEGEVAQAEGEVSQAEGEVTQAEGEVAQAGGDKDASNDLIAMILGAISANNTTVSLNLTSEVFSQLFRELLGFDLFLKLQVGATVDILEGKIGVGLDVEDGIVQVDIGIAIGLGERGAYKFEMNLDKIPDWNAVNGEYMVRSLLKSLEIGLFIDLNQYTSSSGKPMYTRIYIEKLNSRRALPKTGGQTAAKDSILVELAGIDEKEFNNAGSGTRDSWLFAELNWQEGKIYLNICQGFLKLSVIGISIDVGDIMGKLAIDLDLVSMLSGTIDNLLVKIEGLLDGLVKSETAEDLEQLAPVEGEVVDDSAANTNTTNGTIKFTEILTQGELTRKTTVENIGKYYMHNGTYYRIDESATGATATALSVDETYKTYAFKDLPQPTEANANKIFMADEVVTDIVDANGVVTGQEYSYSYYICLSVTRRVFAYYSVEVVSGISGFFGDLDILSLFGKVTLSLTSTGILNGNVEVDDYTINYVIDNLMYYLFGPETILNLQEMTAGSSMSFSQNYLAKVFWDRVHGGAFFEDLWAQIQPILGDVLKGLINIDLSFLMGAITNLRPTLENIIDRLLPFAVGNDNTLGLNIVRGQLTNIYLTMHDENEAIVDKDGKPYTFFNGESTLTYEAGSRNTAYYTELHIFNTSPSVGNQSYTGEQGAVVWDGLPKSITYDPYKYAANADVYTELYNQYFSNKLATYQEGQKLYKQAITFEIIDFTAEGAATATVYSPAKGISKANLGNLTTPGVYTIRATANFNNGANARHIDIKFTVESSAEIALIPTLTMSVYSEFPAYMLAYTKLLENGEPDPNSIRRYSSDTLKFYTKNEEGVKDDGIVLPGYRNDRTADGGWDQEVFVQFPNGYEKQMTIHYYDSTINEVIIAGSENNTIAIDLYQFDTKSEDGTTTSLANYMPEILYFYYPNGIADSIRVDEWIAGNAGELFDRLDPTKKDVYGSVAGAEYTITAVVNSNSTIRQEVPIKFVVRSRQVTSVQFGEKTNTLAIQPYEYYLYVSDPNKYSNYRPYQDKVTVNYDTYFDEVYVEWFGTDTNISYNWDNSNDYFASATVKLDPNQYPSGDLFTWSKDVKVTVARNEIQTIYFDKALTKKNFEINPYEYNNLPEDKKQSYYPKTAFVEFTNGRVLELPIAWKKAEINAYNVDYAKSYTQFTVAIGHDYFEYDKTGEIVKFNLDGTTPFYQEHVVNVFVNGTAIEGVLLEGSELLGGIHYIDPVAVNYQGAAAFPNIVSVRYENGRLGTVEVKNWEYSDNIEMTGSVIKQAKCYITNNLYFTINYQVLDRGEDKMEVILDTLNDPINPYSYIYDEKGNLTYEQFEKYITVAFTTSYTVKLVDVDKKVLHSVTVETVDELIKAKSDMNIAYWDSASKTYIVDGVTCKMSIDYNKTNYDLVAYWDVSRLQPTSLGGVKLIDLYVGYGSNHPIKKSIEVTFEAKKVKKIAAEGSDAGEDAVFMLNRNAANLTDAEKLQAKVTRNLKVEFTDGTFEYVDCEIDLTTLNNQPFDFTETNQVISHGYKSGIVNNTVFTYNPITVAENTVGTYYLKGGYNTVELKGQNTNYAENTYFKFDRANLVNGNTGIYYLRSGGNFVEVELTADNFNAQAIYYQKVALTAEEYASFEGFVYTYDENIYVEVSLNGFGGVYRAGVQYYELEISNEMYAKVTVAKAAGALRQTTQIKVYVV